MFVLSLALSLTLTPQVAFGNSDESCIKKLQYVESRMQSISYNLAQVENIVHSPEFLDTWMKENNYKTENEATRTLQSKFLSPAKLLIQENLNYMQNQYSLDCSGAPYYETGLKYYGEIFSEARKGESNLWVRFDSILQKTISALEKYKPKDTSQDQLQELQNGNFIPQKIKEYSGKLSERISEKLPECKYSPRVPIPFGPSKLNYTIQDLKDFDFLLQSWLIDELSNLDQARCSPLIEKPSKEFSKDDVFKKETELLKKYKDELDRQIISKIGYGCCGYRYLANPPALLEGNFPKSEEHFLDFEKKLQVWQNNEIANLSADNLENPTDFSIDAFEALASQYSNILLGLVKERYGDVKWNFSNPMPSYKGIAGFSKQTYVLYQQSLQNWLATFPVSVQGVTQELDSKNGDSLVTNEKSTTQAPIEKTVAGKASTPQKISITCIRGKLTKKIRSPKPKCPVGYKKK